MTTQPPPGMANVKKAPSSSAKARFLGRLLDPIDLMVEGIYSVLIVLTFTLAVRAADSNDLLTETFGDAYRQYMRRTGRFLPRLGAPKETGA